MEFVTNLIKRVTDYVQKDIQPALADKPAYQLLLKYGLIVGGCGFILLADIRHLVSALLGVVMLGVGLNLYKDKTMSDTAVRDDKTGSVLPVNRSFPNTNDPWDRN